MRGIIYLSIIFILLATVKIIVAGERTFWILKETVPLRAPTSISKEEISGIQYDEKDQKLIFKSKSYKNIEYKTEEAQKIYNRIKTGEKYTLVPNCQEGRCEVKEFQFRR